MTVQMLKLSGKPYVVVPEKDFNLLVKRLSDYETEEKADAAIVRSRLKAHRKPIPLAQVRQELGL